MSRYLVDKFLYQLDREEHTLQRYIDDPTAYVAWWEAERSHYVTPVERTSGHSFTGEERRALGEVDIRTLYALGAHPFLLWTAVLPVLMARLGTFDAAVSHYTGLVRDQGTVDWTT